MRLWDALKRSYLVDLDLEMDSDYRIRWRETTFSRLADLMGNICITLVTKSLLLRRRYLSRRISSDSLLDHVTIGGTTNVGSH